MVSETCDVGDPQFVDAARVDDGSEEAATVGGKLRKAVDRPRLAAPGLDVTGRTHEPQLPLPTGLPGTVEKPAVVADLEGGREEAERCAESAPHGDGRASKRHFHRIERRGQQRAPT